MLAEAEKLGNVTWNVCIFRDREGDFIGEGGEFYLICMISFKGKSSTFWWGGRNQLCCILVTEVYCRK